MHNTRRKREMMKKREIHKLKWLVPSAARWVALAVGILATTGAWAETGNYNPTPVFSQDFESNSTGWSNGSLQSRTTYAGTESKFLYISGATTSSYSFDSTVTSLESYKLEFDWFASMGYNDTTCALRLYAGDNEIIAVEDPNAKNSSLTTAYIYANGDHTANIGTFTTVGRGGSCQGMNNMDKWYHFTIKASSAGITLKIESASSSVGVVFAETRVADFVNISRIQINTTRSSFNATGGIDDITVCTPLESDDDVVATITDGNSVLKYTSVQTAIEEYTSGTLDISASATIALTKEVSISSITLSNNAELTITQKPPYTTTYSDGTLTCVRETVTYTYIGDSTYEILSKNFKIGETVASAYPLSTDTVEFDTDTTLDLSNGDIRYAEVIVNADVTINGDGNHYLYADSISGEGTLALSDKAMVATSTKAGTISCGLEVNASSSNPAYLHVADSGREITLTGELSGSGYLRCTRTKNASDYSGCTFKCSDTTGFIGKIEMVNPGDVGRNLITFWPSCDLSGATVIVGEYRSGYGRIIDNQSNAAIYRFGSFSGYVSPNASNVGNTHPTIEIGALGKDDTVSGNWMPHSERNPLIRKLGSGTFTTSAASAYKYEINGGMVALASALAFPSSSEITFTGNGYLDPTTNTTDFAAMLVGSTKAPIGLYVTNNLTISSSAAIPSSNTKGLVKAGSGTLTLATAPEYSGVTVVKEGVLLVPMDASITCASGTKQDGTVVVDDITYDKYIPYEVASVTIDETTTSYSSVADAIEAAGSSGAVTIIAALASTETIYVNGGETISFTLSDPSSYLTDGATVAIVCADGTTFSATDAASGISYTCPKEYTYNTTLSGTLTLNGDYYTDNQIFVPYEVNAGGVNGILNINSGASLRVKQNIRIATKSNSEGTINVADGGVLTHDTAGTMMLGGTDGSVANLNIAGGAVTNLTGNIECGYNASGATGTVNLSSGKLAMLAGTLVLGNKSGAEGVFNMSGGTFECPATTLDPIKIGTANGGTGTVNLSGNASLTLGKLPVGNVSGATGYVNVTDSASLTIINDFCIGALNGAEGNLTVNGGTVTVESTGKLIPGYNGTGVVEVVSGTLTAKAEAYIGYGGNGNGYLKINGGTFSMPTKDLTVGNNNVAATGCVEVVSGSLCLAKELKLGAINGSESAGSKTSAIISGGKVFANGLKIANATYSAATVDVSGGDVVITNTLVVGQNSNSTGTLNISGGSVTAATMAIAATTFASGTVNLSGGTLTLGAMTTSDEASTASLTIDGGTLAASQDFTAPSGITVKLGAATFAPNGHTITFAGTPTAAENATLTITVAPGAGSVVVPAEAKNSITLGANTAWQGDTTLVYSGGIATDGTATAAYAEGDTAELVAAKYTVTLTPEQTADGLQSSYYKVVATLNNERTQWNISVALADSVAPEIDTSSEPMTVTSSKVSFAVDADSLKTGLYYGVGTRSTPGGTVTHGTMTKFTGSNANDIDFTADLPDSGVLYYTIEASDSKD